MTAIDVIDRADGSYEVNVTEDDTTSTHVVTVHPEDLSRLGSGGSGQDLVQASFRFLLDREEKESIMSRFDLSVIARYFPDYPDMIGDYL